MESVSFQAPMSLRETDECEHLRLGAIHELCELGELCAQLIGDRPPLCDRRFLTLLGKHVLIMASTIWRWPLPACAKTLRGK